MKSTKTDLASLLLRIALGGMFLAHGLTKLFVFTPAGTVQYFASLGFPSILAYLTILFEIGGGILLLLGIFSNWVGLLAALQMVVITYIHSGNGWSFSNTGGGWEYPAFMAFTALALFFLGDGCFSVKKCFIKQEKK